MKKKRGSKSSESKPARLVIALTLTSRNSPSRHAASFFTRENYENGTSTLTASTSRRARPVGRGDECAAQQRHQQRGEGSRGTGQVPGGRDLASPAPWLKHSRFEQAPPSQSVNRRRSRNHRPTTKDRQLRHDSQGLRMKWQKEPGHFVSPADSGRPADFLKSNLLASLSRVTETDEVNLREIFGKKFTEF